VRAVWILYIGVAVGLIGVASARAFHGIWLPGFVVWICAGAFVIRAIELRAARREEPPE
jgi:hypothetical protein